MLGAFRSAHAGPRSAAARIGLAALLACIGLTWTAGASSAFATYGTVSITKKNVGGDAADLFHFDAPSAIKTGGFDLMGGQTFTNTKVEYNTATYAGKYTKAAYTVAEPRATSTRSRASTATSRPPTTRAAPHVARHALGRDQRRRRREGRLHVHQPAQDRHDHRHEAARADDRRAASSTSGRRQGRRQGCRQRRPRLGGRPDRHAHRRRVRREPGRLRPLYEVPQGHDGRRGGLGRRERPGRRVRPDHLHRQERAQGEDRRREARLLRPTPPRSRRRSTSA